MKRRTQGPLGALAMFGIAVTAVAGCSDRLLDASNETDDRSDESPEPEGQSSEPSLPIGPICPDCPAQIGGESSDFGGAGIPPACWTMIRSEPVDDVESIDLASAQRNLELEITSEFEWRPDGMPLGGAPATGFASEPITIDITVTPGSATLGYLDPESCDGVQCEIDGQLVDCGYPTESWFDIEVSVTHETSDRAVSATTIGVVRQYLTGDEQVPLVPGFFGNRPPEPTDISFIDSRTELSRVTGTARVYPEDPAVGAFDSSIYWVGGEVHGSVRLVGSALIEGVVPDDSYVPLSGRFPLGDCEPRMTSVSADEAWPAFGSRTATDVFAELATFLAQPKAVTWYPGIATNAAFRITRVQGELICANEKSIVTQVDARIETEDGRLSWSFQTPLRVLLDRGAIRGFSLYQLNRYPARDPELLASLGSVDYRGAPEVGFEIRAAHDSMRQASESELFPEISDYPNWSLSFEASGTTSDGATSFACLASDPSDFSFCRLAN